MEEAHGISRKSTKSVDVMAAARSKAHVFTIDLDLSMIAVYVFIVPVVICVYLSIISVVLFLEGCDGKQHFC